MPSKHILVVDDNIQSLEIIRPTLLEADVKFEICTSTADGWNLIRTNPQFNYALIRMSSDGVNGCELTRRIREVKTREQLPILMIVGEDQLEYAVNGLDAGASEVMIDPFEARELRMRMNIVPATHRRRIDEQHELQNGSSQPVPEAVTFDSAVVNEAPLDAAPNVVAPRFNSETLQFDYEATGSQIKAWQEDDSVTKVDLDKAMVCPCCQSLPTFRPGCGSCGSAFTKPEMLIHHYACAHIGSESEFQQGDGITCPKCRKSSLVAGADFEVVAGGHVCIDCDSRVSQPELIGHCLSCNHRFPANESVLVQLTGFHVQRVHEVAAAGDKKIAQSKVRRSRAQTVGST